MLTDGPEAADGDVSVIILCGGAGTRLRGADKPLLTIDGIPIVERLSQTLAPLGPVLISANRNRSSYRRYGRVVEDSPGPRRGPLAGIAACLAICDTSRVFVCPGDCPGVTEDLARRLLARLDAPHSPQAALDGVFADDGERPQYLHLALQTRSRSDLEAYLNSGQRSVRGWLGQLRTAVVDCRDQAAAFADVDTEEDLNDRRR